MRSRRIHLSRADFTSVSGDSKARHATSTHFSATCSPKGTGFAVVVSKKVAKSSVARHLLKRRVREAGAAWNSDAYGLIVYARAGSSALPYQVIAEEIAALLPRVLP